MLHLVIEELKGYNNRAWGGGGCRGPQVRALPAV